MVPNCIKAHLAIRFSQRGVWWWRLAAMMLLVGQAGAQTVSYVGGTLTENFDEMGPTGTNTPPGWFAGWTGPGVTFTTNLVVNDGSVAPNETGGWNFGVAGASDRALGTMATSTGTIPPPGTNRFIEVRIQNQTANVIFAINVHYDGEEWRTGSSSSQVNTNVLQFSEDGVNFVSMGASFQFVQPVLTPVSTALDGNASANRRAAIGGSYLLPASVQPDGIIYLRWFDLNDPSTDPGLALDNFSFAAATIVIKSQPQTQSVPPGSNVFFTVAVTGSGPFTYQWKKDGVDLVGDDHVSGSATVLLNISNIQSADLGIYSVIVSNTDGSVLSAPATLFFSAPPFQWIQQAGAAGTANDVGNDIALDGATALFVCGSFGCCADFGATNVTTPAGSAVFLARYLASGAFDWVRTATSASGGGNAYAVASDPLGNCYVTGSFLGTTSFGASNVTSAGGSDVFVAKYDRSGALLWVARQGGGFDDSGRGIAADGTNGCFVTGLLQSSSSAASRDIFVARYNAFGAVQWQRQPVGSSSDAGMAATADQNGNTYITGWFTGTVNFGSTNLTALGAARDIFVAKYNHSGTLQWVASTGGINGDEGKGVGVDTNGNVYATGSFNIGGGGANNAEKLLLTKFDSTGVLVWQRELLANFNYLTFSSATDPAGNTWVVGGFPGTGMLNGVPLMSAGGYDAVVAKYNSAGELAWISQAGGLGSAVVHRAAIDAAGHCYFTGDFDGNAVFGGTNLTSYGGTDIFLGRLGSEIFPPLRLALNITNGIAAIDFSGAPGSIIYLEAARILNGAWSGLTNFALPATVLRWMDAESPDDAQRFYRARLVP